MVGAGTRVQGLHGSMGLVVAGVHSYMVAGAQGYTRPVVGVWLRGRGWWQGVAWVEGGWVQPTLILTFRGVGWSVRLSGTIM